uniref:Uncharacterized protein n=1 Tax=Arabidopsis thaliana TaxID=3702 RepID=Q0WWZ9_ARATH|nr:hypothetical protein [Arabidopsis thaliana]
MPGYDPPSPFNHLKHKRRVFAATFLVSPMSCKPKFCLQMHLLCTYLDFKWNCSIVHHYRVQRLIPVEFGMSYVILQLSRNFRP